ncbi:hypothetical protein KFE25_013260 [Diacronema lutheri]|uniref:KxDL domain-containing protein n=2 Tax=Diacronema lutheri TaxID=2081491 RepID=A0A8J5XTF9_DIALT|nr:hypothetical protein KFE25_013260 [Diacronema lutheri]
MADARSEDDACDVSRALSAQLGSAIADGVLAVNSPDDLRNVLAIQEELLHKLADSNKALRSLNEHAAENLAHASSRFAQHTSTVTQLTADLTRAYTRIRQLKERLKRKFPHAFEQASAGALRSPLGLPLDAARESVASGGRSSIAHALVTGGNGVRSACDGGAPGAHVPADSEADAEPGG